MQHSPDAAGLGVRVGWNELKVYQRQEVECGQRGSSVQSTKIKFRGEFYQRRLFDCSFLTVWDSARSGLHWNPNRSASTSSRGRGASAESRTGVCLDRGLLVSAGKALPMAPGLLDGAAVCGRPLGSASL